MENPYSSGQAPYRMEKRLSDLLARLPIPGLKESNQRHLIAERLTEIIKIPIKPKQIQFKDNILTVAVPPIVKSVLHVKQTEIIALLGKESIEVKLVR